MRKNENHKPAFEEKANWQDKMFYTVLLVAIVLTIGFGIFAFIFFWNFSKC